ncbi:S41 family peptidase, partial [Acidovorax cavernicola]
GGGGGGSPVVSLLPDSGTGGTPPTTTEPATPQTPGEDDDALRNAPWAEGVFRTASLYKDRCAAPRTGNDYFGVPFKDKPGRTLDENNWLRSWINDTYLWYAEVPDLDPARYATTDYFDLLKTSAVTPSGIPKDQFHFTYPTDAWNALDTGGVEVGYGAHWAMIQAWPPRHLRVAYTEPGSPAAQPGSDLQRGALVLKINGVDFVNDQSDEGLAVLNAGMFPSAPGVSTRFTVLDIGSTVPRDITLVSAPVTSTPVQNVRSFRNAAGRMVGYLQFNDHIATAEVQLAQAIEQLRAVQPDELVVDLRYNGGGYLSMASQLAFMVAGAQRTDGKVFMTEVFNGKQPGRNPVTGSPSEPFPFLSTGIGFSLPAGQPLSSLNLRRVYVLSGPDTCSASEAFINGLRGIDIEVIQVGTVTCGKPYGFYPEDNCGTTYFSVQMRAENAKGFGDYADGFAPTCEAWDDLRYPLGDPREERLAAALTHQVTGACPPLPAGRQSLAKSAVGRPTPLLRKPEALRNNIMTRRRGV